MTNELTREFLDELSALNMAASLPPWRVDPDNAYVVLGYSDNLITDNEMIAVEDAALVVAMRNAIPYLIDAARDSLSGPPGAL